MKTQKQQKIQAIKPFTCKRCHIQTVQWERSRFGKFYLVNVDSNNMTARNDFHSCQPEGFTADDAREDSNNLSPESRAVIVDSLKNLLAAPDACKDSVCTTTFKPVGKQGSYQCTACPKAKLNAVVPGKPVMCSCGTIMRFTGLVK